MGHWEPSAAAFAALSPRKEPGDDPSRPYPFCLASPFEGEMQQRSATATSGWWSGSGTASARSSCIAAGEVFLWSRGEELITERFPEIVAAARGAAGRHGARRRGPRLRATDARGRLPICSAASGASGACGRWRRTCRWSFSPTTCSKTGGADIRALPLRDRRARLLRSYVAGAEATAVATRVSEELAAPRWEALARLPGRIARAARRRPDAEAVGVAIPPRPQRGDWWKWKIEPFTVDAVLMYAQPGSGRRASLFTDYTFGVWDDGELVPGRQGLFGTLRRGDRRTGSLGAASHDGAVRAGERGGAGARLRARVRANRARRLGTNPDSPSVFPACCAGAVTRPAREADTLETLTGMVRR